MARVETLLAPQLLVQLVIRAAVGVLMRGLVLCFLAGGIVSDSCLVETWLSRLQFGVAAHSTTAIGALMLSFGCT